MVCEKNSYVASVDHPSVGFAASSRLALRCAEQFVTQSSNFARGVTHDMQFRCGIFKDHYRFHNQCSIRSELVVCAYGRVYYIYIDLKYASHQITFPQRATDTQNDGLINHMATRHLSRSQQSCEKVYLRKRAG